MAKVKFGLYEQVINEIINEYLDKIDNEFVISSIQSIDSAESTKILSVYLARILRETLGYIDEGDTAVKDRVEFCNSILMHIADCIQKGSFNFKHDELTLKRVKSFLIRQDAKLLLSLVDRSGISNTMLMDSQKIVRPSTSIAENSLFTGAVHEPSMVSELKKEIVSSNRIDFLISFIKWSGLRLIINELTKFVMNGGKLRVITTSYLGATDYKSIEQLSKLPNTEIRISYDTDRTRLHAKTYMFWRDTGFSTIYIGSSNISEPAMTSGLEWNLKLSEYDSRDILDKVRATFEGYWNSSEFIHFMLGIDDERLKKSLHSEKRTNQEEENSFTFNFDINPYYYQQEILDKLKAEREVHGFYKNLVVAATGTGKTVIAAFDYKDFCRMNPQKPNKLLFIAHRKEILDQSHSCFQGILKDLNFGSKIVGGIKTDDIDHLFISIQSFNSRKLTELTAPDYYDYIIIDEFHHAAAPSYQELIEYYRPKVLLGLTATPERADGQDIFAYFNGRISAELRLYEAIERKLLSSFHYFGVTDSVDYSNVRWEKGRYDDKELDNLLVLEKVVAEKRVGYILNAIDRYCTNFTSIIGIGFCATKKHAQYMANIFNKNGIPSEYLISESKEEIRDNVKRRLVNREINFIFVVDIYNEGVDIPEVNTVLFLRPTESLTVFVQQLGRGLRLSDGKEVLTVLDFVGQANKKYSFEDRYKAMLTRTRKTVEQEIRAGFVNVPRGCSIQLEKQAQEYILRNIRDAINNKVNLVRKLKEFILVNRELKIRDFFEAFHINPRDIYSKNTTVCGLASQEGLIKKHNLDQEREKLIASTLGRLSFINSERWIKFLLKVLPQIQANRGTTLAYLSSIERTMLRMFYYTIWGKGLEDLGYRFDSIEKAIFWAIDDRWIYDEVMEILEYQFEKIDIVSKSLDQYKAEFPLDLYCSYTLDQILVALGKHTEENKSHFREGALYIQDNKLDVFFVTLNKSEKDYSPSTMYQDYAISNTKFHWQSQSRTTEESPTGQRYINQLTNGGNVLFFVREYKKDASFTSPYICIGLADYQNHYGSAPINIVWNMKESLPGFVMQQTVKA